MQDIEIEVKFHLAAVEKIRRGIVSLGAHSTGRVFENNYRFDTPGETLRRQAALLRLRQDSRCTVTYKATLKTSDKEFKARRELEVEVSDFSIMNRIIEALGFKRVQVYEKYRETFVLGDSTLCLDTMPFGDFLEIEGSRTAIRELARQLGMEWSRRILTNYIGIHNLLRQGEDLSFGDITFENYSNIVIDWARYLPTLTAG
jgi:adenylate cyclase class 2